MKIKLINPNTSRAMTEDIELAGKAYAGEGTEIYAVSPGNGPDSIECYVDEFLAVPGVLEEIVKGDREEGADAYIIACFGDPGLQAGREITEKPVIGIAEAAMSAARVIAPNFSVISVLDRSRKMTEDLVYAYGMERFCRSVRSTGLSVLEFGEDRKKGLEALAREAEKAVKEDGAECILLGCAGFAAFSEKLRQSLKVPVLDGVVPAVKFAEAMVEMELKTNKTGSWSYPEAKSFRGYGFMGR